MLPLLVDPRLRVLFVSSPDLRPHPQLHHREPNHQESHHQEPHHRDPHLHPRAALKQRLLRLAPARGLLRRIPEMGTRQAGQWLVTLCC